MSESQKSESQKSESQKSALQRSELQGSEFKSFVGPVLIAGVVAAALFFAVPGDRPEGLLDFGRGVGEAYAQSPARAQSSSVRAPERSWTASAPGKVEPRNGEIKIMSKIPGRIVEVLVEINDTVKQGDLLIRLDDEEARARLRAARAEADARKRSRDVTDVNRLADRRREADDDVYDARFELFDAREEMDAEAEKLRDGDSTEEKLDAARKKVADAKVKLKDALAKLRKAQRAKKVPLETLRESALSKARAEVALAEAALRHTQIRAPSDGSVLDVLAKVGEMTIPTPRSILLRFGDMTALRVRAEVEERDVGNVRVGQRVMVRSNAFPGKEFPGKVRTRARTLGPNKISAAGPRRPTDLDVLEALVDLEGMPPLLPGMRVDVYFLSDDASTTKQPAAATAVSKSTN